MVKNLTQNKKLLEDIRNENELDNVIAGTWLCILIIFFIIGFIYLFLK